MYAISRLVALFAIVLLPSVAPAASITGEVRAIQAQPIYTPPSNSSPVVLRYYIADGTEVAKGDPILRIDPGQAGARLRTLAADIERAEARAQKESADLQVKAIDAELAWIDAQAALDKARIDAALPRDLLSGLDYDRYQGELQRTERELVLKRGELKEARDAVERRRGDARLELERMRLEERYQRTQLTNAEVRAEHGGIVLHGFDPWNGLRFDEGSSAQIGQLVGEVATVQALGVRAYALETEREAFKRDDLVTIDFDALPTLHAIGRIESISGAPEARQMWGTGRYFTIDIRFEGGIDAARLLPGMSVRVRSQDAGQGARMLRAQGRAGAAAKVGTR
jgi:HlyD family secretion protein